MSDLISRQAAIDAIQERMDSFRHADCEWAMNAYNGACECAGAIKSLPSAESETAKRIVGKSRDGMTFWYQCDMCNEPVDAQDNFCRRCGRRLTDE